MVFSRMKKKTEAAAAEGGGDATDAPGDSGGTLKDAAKNRNPETAGAGDPPKVIESNDNKGNKFAKFDQQKPTDFQVNFEESRFLQNGLF